MGTFASKTRLLSEGHDSRAAGAGLVRRCAAGVQARVLGLATAVVVAAGLATPAWALTSTQQMDLKVLVISADGTESTFAAWTAALDREGVPYDTLIANTAAPISAATLADGPSHARYQAVVLATGGLYQCDAVSCQSALGADEWAALNAYEAAFGVRRVTSYAWPNPEYGLHLPFSSGELGGTTANLTEDGKAAFTYLAGPLPIDGGSWGYYAEPLPPATSSAPPFRTLVAGPAGPGGAGSSLVGVYTRPDGFEELVITVAMNQYPLQALLISHGLIQWATRGVHLGYARSYFMMHIDDIFLPDDRWDPVNNTTHEDDGATLPVIRMVPADVSRAVAWQKANGLQMDFLFNGDGSDDASAKAAPPVLGTKIAKTYDPLTAKLLAVRGQFTWLNHTFSHLNLDLLSQAEIVAEIQKNILWAKNKGFPIKANELVTGEHSGLGNVAMPAALTQLGIAWVGSDNSKQPLPYQIGSATTIPRYPSNVYYNAATFAEQLDEYNYLYFENCTNTATTTCLSALATWGSYVNSEASIMLRHLLLNDPRPHYFHQSNLAEDGVFYTVVNEVLARYHAYMAVPLAQPLFGQSGVIMARAAAWHAGSASAYYKNGKVVVTSPTALLAPVTGTSNGLLYGTERSTWVSLGAGATKVFTSVTLL